MKYSIQVSSTTKIKVIIIFQSYILTTVEFIAEVMFFELYNIIVQLKFLQIIKLN